TYTIASVTGSDAGSYDVVVSNPCGSVTSNPAALTIPVPVAVNDSYATAEDTTLTVSVPGVLANDSGSCALSLSALRVNSPPPDTSTLNTNSSFSYVPATN